MLTRYYNLVQDTIRKYIYICSTTCHVSDVPCNKSTIITPLQKVMEQTSTHPIKGYLQ